MDNEWASPQVGEWNLDDYETLDGYYWVEEIGGGVGSSSGGVGVFDVGLRRVPGADDQPSTSRSFYRNGWFWGYMGFPYF